MPPAPCDVINYPWPGVWKGCPLPNMSILAGSCEHRAKKKKIVSTSSQRKKCLLTPWLTTSCSSFLLLSAFLLFSLIFLVQCTLFPPPPNNKKKKMSFVFVNLKSVRDPDNVPHPLRCRRQPLASDSFSRIFKKKKRQIHTNASFIDDEV